MKSFFCFFSSLTFSHLLPLISSSTMMNTRYQDLRIRNKTRPAVAGNLVLILISYSYLFELV